MCIKYIRRYINCPQSHDRPDGVHVLKSTIPCSSPFACEGEGFGTRNVTFAGSCEQHSSSEDWATFDRLRLAPTEDNFQISGDAQALANNIRSYVDSLLQFLVVLMNETATLKSQEYVKLEIAVQTIAQELRCPSCADDVTVCQCPPGRSRARYNISRAFRTSEAQRLLPILRHRFGEDVVQRSVWQNFAPDTGNTRPPPQRSLVFDLEPPLHGTAIVVERKIRDTIENLAGSRRAQLDQGDELGRVQWSAVNIIGSFVKFDSGLPETIAEYIGRAIFPMLYPEKAIRNSGYRFAYRIASLDNTIRSPEVRSRRLTENDFWTQYHAMILHFSQSARRTDNHKVGLSAMSDVIATRMDDLRQIFHDLQVEERDTFEAVVKDLMPVIKHVTTEELERNLSNPPAMCTVCNIPFSTQLQEPETPQVGTFPPAQTREQKVHNPVRYNECAFVPHQHAFCLREFGRTLMNRNQQTGNFVAKPKTQWRCTTCYVDPWRAGGY